MSYEQQETSKAKRIWSENISEVRDKQKWAFITECGRRVANG